MNYRSLADLNAAIVSNLHRLPPDIDLVIGVPRSGLLAANMLSLLSNIPLIDLDTFLDGRRYTSGTSNRTENRDLTQPRRILVLDDSISSGKAMREARDRISGSGSQAEFFFAAVFGIEAGHKDADLVFERVTLPRIFQWNFMHHILLEQACVDIDGVLCIDPTEHENRDGEACRGALSDAVPLYTSSRKIGCLVTSRPEGDREPTEAWLKRQGIEYGELVMRNGSDKEEDGHAGFKAEIYRKAKSNLFIESQERQAEIIARLSGKPVLCVQTQQVHLPNPMSSAAVRQQMRNLPLRLKQFGRNTGNRWKIMARGVLGASGYEALKKLVGPRSRS